jgi:hypothetical protein
VVVVVSRSFKGTGRRAVPFLSFPRYLSTAHISYMHINKYSRCGSIRCVASKATNTAASNGTAVCVGCWNDPCDQC